MSVAEESPLSGFPAGRRPTAGWRAGAGGCPALTRRGVPARTDEGVVPCRRAADDGPVVAPRIDDVLMLPGGRRLAYAEYGATDGVPGFYFHGHPGSRFEAQFGHEAASELGIRIIAMDRPGYGRSDVQPGRRILDWPGDVAGAADLLGIREFSVLGGSGGGPYALACGFALPQRVTRVGVVSGVGPYDAPHAADGMRWQNRVGFRLGARVPPVSRLIMWSMARQVRRDPARVVDAVARAMSGADADVVQRPDVHRILEEDIAEAFRQGSRGAAEEVVLLGRPWGFDVADVRVPVMLWQGEADRLVSPAMGRYLAGRIPGCRAWFYPGEGHLLVVSRISEILGEFGRAGG